MHRTGYLVISILESATYRLGNPYCPFLNKRVGLSSTGTIGTTSL